jgi:hypothetical protein
MLGAAMGRSDTADADGLPEPLAGLVQRIHELSCREHELYDREVWEARPDARVELDGHAATPSYHNHTHVQSVVDCVGAVWSRSRELGDPFELEPHLAEWRARHHNRHLDWNLLGAALKIAFSCHDLGNITASPRIENGGDGYIRLHLASRYDSSALYERPEVEMRSADLACQLLARLLGEGPHLNALRPLVCHLILQTVFHFDQVQSDEPFWLTMQTVDMVGSYFFAPQRRSHAVAGLFNEMRIQSDGRGEVSVAGFLPSLLQRFERLLPDPDRRRRVLQLFEANPYGQDHESVFAVPDSLAQLLRPAPFADAIAVLLRD